jgi:hypothetical protein
MRREIVSRVTITGKSIKTTPQAYGSFHRDGEEKPADETRPTGQLHSNDLVALHQSIIVPNASLLPSNQS